MNWAALLCVALLAAEPNRPIDFDTEIIPVLTKAGCNSGACHGAAAGRGGFHLSLFGSDPAADHEAIVHALEGRRINRAKPAASLVLAKPTGQIDHGGDVALEPDGAGAQRLAAWIQAGARRGKGRRLTSVAAQPDRVVLEGHPVDVPLRVTAAFDETGIENVTAWTLFTTSDPAAVEIDVPRGVACVRRRGWHVVIARFLDQVLPIQLVVPLTDTPIDLSHEPQHNFIDHEILQTLTVLRIPVSPTADDAAFARRACLDLTGRLAEPAEIEEFLASSAADKRARWIERLLQSDAYVDYWTLRFARLLHLHSLPNESEAVRAYAQWIRQQIQAGTPLNEMGRQLLIATGDSHAVGPANYARMVGDARGHAELVGQFFLGARLGCANCHNHPLDRWTQDDYHGLAAVFARVERGRHVLLAPRGAVTNLRTGEPAVPRIPGHKDLTGDGDHRLELADWMVSPENRAFAEAAVNRLWQAMFGRGLVEPTDDLRVTNLPTHPALLERLAGDFAENGYDLRHTLRRIALSHTYARSAATLAGNAADDRFYSHAYRRPLGPEVLADAIADVTGVANDFRDQPTGTRAVKLVDPLTPAPSLDILGRCSRAGGCEENAGSSGGLPAQLHLLNGELLNRKVADPNGRLHRLVAAGKSDAEMVGEFYLRALGRRPSPDELARWSTQIAAGPPGERVERLEDFVWSLLSSRAFGENH